MTRSFRVALVLGAAAVVAVIATLVVPGLTQEVSAADESCCFTNPRFTGVCKVTPGEDESCSSILGYLNNPNSTGKAYCGGTPVRGGWQQVACEE
jgi:hypothetical protein